MPPFGALAPFRVRSYRFQWPADLLTSWAFEMETLILGWYVLVETNSVVMLTIFGALLYGGTLIAPIVGVWSDRIGHRNIDRKSTRLNSSHLKLSRMPSSA